MDRYQKTFDSLVQASGSGFWDFRTLMLSRYSDIGAELAEQLVNLGVIDTAQDALKHFVPTPKFLAYLNS
jgi:hypothetical protein